MSEWTNHFYTTQKKVAYTFRDLTNPELVNTILNLLDNMNSKATFFVTGKEIQNNPDLIKEIASRGHHLANGGYGMVIDSPRNLDFESISYEIDMGEQYLKNLLGNEYVASVNKMYMPLYGDTGGYVLEAASSLGYKKVFTYNKSTSRQEYQDSNADDIISSYFANTVTLQRGDIVYFRLNYLKQENVVPELIKKIAENYIYVADYEISSLTDLSNSPLVYQPKTRTEAALIDNIQLSKAYSSEVLLKKIYDYYIGNPDINSMENLIGFTTEEVRAINTEGRIKTNGEKVIFLTFDDWGSDSTINELLDVLNKYQAKATFFVRVGSDYHEPTSDFSNPNLLRAIGLEGHDIANHSFQHVKVDITSENQKEIIQKDLLAANNEMMRYLSDLNAQKNFFRPPTLAVSKQGLETITNMGFEYIVNGDFSTHDYEATSVEELANKLMYGISEDRKIESGSIVVMHMNDASQYTASALDIVIPYFMNQGYSFAKLSDYLTKGYKNSPRQIVESISITDEEFNEPTEKNNSRTSISQIVEEEVTESSAEIFENDIILESTHEEVQVTEESDRDSESISADELDDELD